jgi:hypothetical protein
MNAKNIPGFTAEKAIFTSRSRHREAGVFESRGSLVCIEPAMIDTTTCENLAAAFQSLPDGSFASAVIAKAYFQAGAGRY